MNRLYRIPARISVFVLIAFAAINVNAQTGLVSLEDIFSDPKIEGTRPRSGSISPNSQWVVYIWTDSEVDSVAGLYKVPVSGGAPEKLESPFRASIRWKPDEGNSLVFTERGNLVTLNVANGSKTILAEDIGISNSFTYSPDERMIAFSGRNGLWIINSDGSDLKQLTLSSASSLQWTQDNEFIFFLHEDNIWKVNVNTRIVEKITDEQPSDESGQGFSSGGLRGFSLSPDAAYITFSRSKSNTPERDIIVPHYVDRKYVWPQRARNSFPDDPYGETSLFLVDADNKVTGEIDLGVNKEFRIRSQDWSPDGSLAHLVLLTADNHDLYHLIVDPKTGSASIIDHERDDAWIGGPGFDSFWDKEGENIIFTSERSGYNHLWRVSVRGGAPVQLTSGNWELESAMMLEDNETLIFQSTEVDPAERHLYALNLESGRKTKITGSEGMNQIASVSQDGRYILYMHASTLRPGDYFITEIRGGSREIQLSFSIPERFKDTGWIAPEFVWFNNHVDGTPLYAMRYDPPGLDQSARYPAVIFVHGAGYTQNTIKGWATYSPNIKFHTRLAQKGYVVLDLDYRGSSGYGRKFRTDVYMYLGGKDLEDEVAGVEYLETLGYVDTGYIGLYGGSYGGFMTLMALFLEPDRFKAGAALRSVTDWENYNAGYTQQRLGRVSENKEAYIKSSPIHHAENLKGHLLLMHGLIDDNVFAQDSIQLLERLIKLGKSDLFEFALYPSQRHGFTDPDHWIDEYRRIEKLFDNYLMIPMGLTPVDDKEYK
ncbi:prolyl oligopeptidase family serine peptidase [candidate division KSB1 bacterium]